MVWFIIWRNVKKIFIAILIFHYCFFLKICWLGIGMPQFQEENELWGHYVTPISAPQWIKWYLSQGKWDSCLFLVCPPQWILRYNHSCNCSFYLDELHISPLEGVCNISIHTKVNVPFVSVAYAGTAFVSLYSSFLIHHIE